LNKGVRVSHTPALSVDATALNNEASEHAYNPKGREKEVHIHFFKINP